MEELNGFLRSHRVVAVEKQWCAEGADGYWNFCVEYLDGSVVSDKKNLPKSRIDYKEVLSEEDFSMYVKLRDLRK